MASTSLDNRFSSPDGAQTGIRHSFLAAWSKGDPDAAWSFPSAFHGGGVPSGPGYKVHVLLDRAARLPLGVPFGPLLSPANRNDLPFAYPLLWFGRCVLALPIHIVRADGAYWGKDHDRFIVTDHGAQPIIPFNRKKQPLARVRHLVFFWPLSYLARAGVPSGPERFFAAAKRSDGLDASYRLGWTPFFST